MGGKQLENDRHFMFISFLTLAILAFFIGEANNMALSERAKARSASTQDQHSRR
jgi:hypothetical protein